MDMYVEWIVPLNPTRNIAKYTTKDEHYHELYKTKIVNTDKGKIFHSEA